MKCNCIITPSVKWVWRWCVKVCVQHNKPLVSKLIVSNCQLPEQWLSLLTNSLKEKTMLKYLVLTYCISSSVFFIALKDSLWVNPMLTDLFIYTKELSEKEGADLVAAVKNNFWLKNFTTCVRDPKQWSLHKCIPCLNDSGWCYLIEDPGSRAKGIQVLRNVIDDWTVYFFTCKRVPCFAGITGCHNKQYHEEKESLSGSRHWESTIGHKTVLGEDV